MNPYAVAVLVDALLAALLAVVAGSALRDSRRAFLARRRDLEQQLGRPLDAVEVWGLYR